jgi:hypothetical protein
MVAVLSPCDCKTSSFSSFYLQKDFVNKDGMLADARKNITIVIGSLTAKQNY